MNKLLISFIIIFISFFAYTLYSRNSSSITNQTSSDFQLNQKNEALKNMQKEDICLEATTLVLNQLPKEIEYPLIKEFDFKELSKQINLTWHGKATLFLSGPLNVDGSEIIISFKNLSINQHYINGKSHFTVREYQQLISQLNHSYNFPAQYIIIPMGTKNLYGYNSINWNCYNLSSFNKDAFNSVQNIPSSPNYVFTTSSIISM